MSLQVSKAATGPLTIATRTTPNTTAAEKMYATLQALETKKKLLLEKEAKLLQLQEENAREQAELEALKTPKPTKPTTLMSDVTPGTPTPTTRRITTRGQKAASSSKASSSQGHAAAVVTEAVIAAAIAEDEIRTAIRRENQQPSRGPAFQAFNTYHPRPFFQGPMRQYNEFYPRGPNFYRRPYNTRPTRNYGLPEGRNRGGDLRYMSTRDVTPTCPPTDTTTTTFQQGQNQTTSP